MIKDDWQNCIDSEWVDGGADQIDVINPSSGKKLAKHALADDRDVDRPVRAANRVQMSGALSDLCPIERGRMVQARGRYLLAHIDDIAPVLTLEQGKPLWESRIEGAARSLSAALATGNTCVIKTPELTPLANAWFARAAKSLGLPAGAVNIPCGLGHQAGATLSNHPLVNQIVFTGSFQTGITISTAAARNVVPCILELAANQRPLFVTTPIWQRLKTTSAGEFISTRVRSVPPCRV